jgi:RNA polymerase sigma-70 factor (ECF subfamily)
MSNEQASDASGVERADSIQQHAGAIGRTCMALLGSQVEAEQALRETLAAANDGFESRPAQHSLRAWLLGIARQRCAARLAARARERVTRLGSGAPAGARQSMPERARRLLDDVRPSEREALVLRFTAELSCQEVAQACGVDEVSARKRISGGLARVVSLLSEEKS